MAFDPSTIPDSQKIKLTLDSSVISSDQTDFPLTIHLDDTDPLHADLFSDLGLESKKLSIETEVLVGSTITAKTVLLDIADNHGDASLIGIRSVEFHLDGTLIPMTTGFTATATSYYGVGYEPATTFNTSLSKIGARADTTWLGANGTTTNQRLKIVFDTSIEFDEVVINNHHHNGGLLTVGVNNVVITSSTDDITSTVYEDTITNATVLYDGVLAQHIAADTADDQTYYTAPLTDTELEQLPIEIENWGEHATYAGNGTSSMISASSIFHAEYAAADAFDGITNDLNLDRWLSADGTLDTSTWLLSDTWLQFDFGEAVAMSQVRFYRNSYAVRNQIKRFNVLVSDTGAFAGEETDLGELTSDSPAASSWGQWNDIANPTSARYLRIDILESTQDSASTEYITCGEIEFNTYVSRATLHTKVPTYSSSTDTELTLSYDSTQVDNTDYVGEIEVDTIVSTSDGIFLLSDTSPTTSTLTTGSTGIVDGNLWTGNLGGNTSANESNGTDLGSAQAVDSFLVYMGHTGGPFTGYYLDYNTFAIYSSDDNATWTLVETVVAPTIEYSILDSGTCLRVSMATQQTARYFKLLCVNTGIAFTGGVSARVEEIEAYTAPTSAVHTAVWNSDFNLVYHMHQDPSGTAPQVLDSTSNRLNSTSTGTMLTEDLVASVPGLGLDFDGTDDYLIVPDDAMFDIGTGDFLFTQVLTLDSVTSGVFFSLDSYTTGVMSYLSSGSFYLYVVGTATSAISLGISTSTTFVLTLQRISGVVHVFVDDAEIGTGTSLPGSIAVTQGMRIAYGFAGGANDYLDGAVSEFRFLDNAKSEDWIVLTSLSLTDQLITFSSLSTSYLLSVLSQEYDMLHYYIISILSQPYDLGSVLIAVLDQTWGDTFLAVLSQQYDDKSLILGILNQFYDDKNRIRAILKQPYEDRALTMAVLKQPYVLRSLMLAALVQKYKSVELIPPTVLKQTYDIKDTSTLHSILKQYYSLIGDSTELPPVVVTPEINGARAEVLSIDYEYNIDSYCAVFSLQLANYGDWLKLEFLQPVIVTINGVEHHTIVSDFNSNESVNSNSYPVESRSQAILLDFPYAEAVLDDFDHSGTAYEVCERLANLEGLSITWHMDSNPPQSASTIQLTGNSPLSGIKSIVNPLGGKVNSMPDGSIHIVKRYPVNTDKFDQATPDITLTTLDDFTAVNTDTVKSYGYNIYTVSNTTSSDGYAMYSEEITSSHIEIRASKVPWNSEQVVLETSELTNVVIVPKGATEEEVTETIEIKNGTGNVAESYYGTVEYSYPTRTDLGAPTVTEDGVVTTAADGTTLLDITYRTRYWKWDTYNTDQEKVQFILVKP